MRVVLLGDSHLARVRRDLHRIGETVVNAAVGGARADDVLAQAHACAVGVGDVAVLSVGTNDAWRGPAPDAFEAHLIELVDACTPGAWVYVVPPGVDERRGTLRTCAEVAAYADVGRRVLADRGARCVDTPALLAPLGPAAFTDDGIHLTGAAYDVLLPAIRAALA